MNLGSPKWVDGIVTQGRHQGALALFCSIYCPESLMYSTGCCQQWVSRYAVLTSEDGFSWSSQGVYPGNIAWGEGLQYTVFKPVRAQYVRVVPVSWNQHITMRVDVLLGDGDSLEPKKSEYNCFS